MINLKPSSKTFLIVGLGNPGLKHRYNRHNVGFILLDHLAAEFDLAFTRHKSQALITHFRLESKKVILSKPQTYVNLSGRSVAPLIRFYRLPTSHLLVAYDDLDLPAGTIRLRPSGGAGGHRGMRSIIDSLGTNDFPRLRIGIGRPPGRMDPADYVLRDLKDNEREELAFSLKSAVDCIRRFLVEDIQSAMTWCNSDP